MVPGEVPHVNITVLKYNGSKSQELVIIKYYKIMIIHNFI